MTKEKRDQHALEMRRRNGVETSSEKIVGLDTTVPKLSIKQAAERLNMSTDWTRRYFMDVPGVLVLPTAKKKARRKQVSIMIPAPVFEREYSKFVRS